MNFLDIPVLDYGANDINPKWWNDITSIFFKMGSNFVISCWNEDNSSIQNALQYGYYDKQLSTKYMMSIVGKVTA